LYFYQLYHTGNVVANHTVENTPELLTSFFLEKGIVL